MSSAYRVTTSEEPDILDIEDKLLFPVWALEHLVRYGC